MAEKRFEFTIVMSGYGETPESAWQDTLDTMANDSHFQTFDANEIEYKITDIDGKTVDTPKREYVLVSTLDANNQFALVATDTESALYEALNLLNYTLTSN